jgi:hypothetical protein
LYQIIDDSQQAKEANIVAEKGAFSYKSIVPTKLRSSVNQSFVIDAANADESDQI